MTNLLVTGHLGEAHVTSAQVGQFQAGFLGAGDYILPIGNSMAATLPTTNSVKIDSGIGIAEGRVYEVPSGGVTLTIDNGSQGLKRNDLVVRRYTKDGGGIESVVLAVIKGTAAEVPVDPAYETDTIISGALLSEMPLYRIVIDGITPQTPVCLVPLAVSQDSLIVTTGTGTATVVSWTVTDFSLQRSGKVVTCQCNMSYSQNAVMDNYYGLIPEGFRPTSQVNDIVLGLADGTNAYVGIGHIATSGQVRFNSIGKSVSQVFFSASWIVG